MKTWAIIFGVIGLIGVVASIVNGNLLYMGICSIVMALSIAYDPEKEVEE